MQYKLEKEIRTDIKGMLVCKAIRDEKGEYVLVKRDGKKEDTISVTSLLQQVYGYGNNTVN